MRPAFLCLLLSFLVACATSSAPVQTRPGTGFSVADDDRGPAWTWDHDPSLRVVLLQRSDLPPGLMVQHGDRTLSMPVDYGLGPMDLPVLLVFPRSDGAEPLAADDSPGLHLLLAGSDEHGCPADDLELDLWVQPDGDELRVDVLVSGVPYLALPPDARITVVDDGGARVLEADQVCADGASLELSGLRRLSVTDSSLGPLELSVQGALPWAQLQGHGDFIEVDFDHSCEQSDSFTAASLHLQARL